MKIVTLRLAITLLTFLIGISITGLLTIHSPLTAEQVSTLAPTVTELKVKPNRPEGWKRIDVDNKFSFYLPPAMRHFDPVGCPFGESDAFTKQSLWVSYDYLPKEQVEEGRGKLSCAVLEGAPTGRAVYQLSEVEVGGRKARQIFSQLDNPKLTLMTLCFPDAGGGAILRFVAGSGEGREMGVARQIFETVEFR